MAQILFNSKSAKEHPLSIALIGFIYATISILIASQIFPSHASLIAIFFTVLPCLYVVQKTIRIEEQHDLYMEEKNLLKAHSKTIKLLLALFVGIVVSFAFMTFILPQETNSHIFSVQQSVVTGIQNQITGNAIETSHALPTIITNNLKVLAISFILSLIYGAGAIFILSWNASIMGFIIGQIAKTNSAIYFPAAFLKYFIHGLPEMAAYFVAILAGGIIYISFINGDLLEKTKLQKISKDIAILTAIAISLIAISGLIEVFISPLI